MRGRYRLRKKKLRKAIEMLRREMPSIIETMRLNKARLVAEFIKFAAREKAKQ